MSSALDVDTSFPIQPQRCVETIHSIPNYSHCSEEVGSSLAVGATAPQTKLGRPFGQEGHRSKDDESDDIPPDAEHDLMAATSQGGFRQHVVTAVRHLRFPIDALFRDPRASQNNNEQHSCSTMPADLSENECRMHSPQGALTAGGVIPLIVHGCHAAIGKYSRRETAPLSRETQKRKIHGGTAQTEYLN